MKKFFIIIVCGGFSAAMASAHFFFPATARNVLTGVAAMAVSSWDDAFGSQDISYATEEVIIEGENVEEVTATSEDPVVIEELVAIEEPNPDQKIAEAVDIPNQIDTSTSQPTELQAPVILPSSTCDFASSVNKSPTHSVIINEIAWMGSVPLTGETSAKASNREWIELKNISGGVIDISGWRLVDPSRKLEIDFQKGAYLAVGDFYLLGRGSASGTLPGVTFDALYSGILVNDGDSLMLFDEKCNVVDRIDALGGWPGGDNVKKQTLERDGDGYGWHTSVSPGGTPRKENSIPPPPVVSANTVSVAQAATVIAETSDMTSAATTTANVIETAEAVEAATSTATSTKCLPASTTTTATTATSTVTSSVNSLVIAEIQIAGGASSEDFIKIFNPTAEAIDISGWKLRKKSKSGADYSLRVFPGDASVLPGGYFAWANSANGFGDAIQANATSTETLSADNSVALFDAAGVIVDAVAWGEGTNQYIEGSPFPTNPDANQILKRRFANGSAIVDTNNNANDFTL